MILAIAELLRTCRRDAARIFFSFCNHHQTFHVGILLYDVRALYYARTYAADVSIRNSGGRPRKTIIIILDNILFDRVNDV
jgi:hypothetical protein